MAQVQAQQFIDVVAQLLQIPFGSRDTADPNRATTTTNASIAVEDREQIGFKDWYSKKDWFCGSVSSKQSLWHVILFTDVSIRTADVSYQGCRKDFYQWGLTSSTGG